MEYRYAIIILAVVVYAWRMNPSNSATLKTIVFHFQTLLTIMENGGDLTAHFFHSSNSSLNFSMVAIECIFPWWNLEDTLVSAVSLPAVYACLYNISIFPKIFIYKAIAIVTFCVCAISTLGQYICGRAQNWIRLKARFINLFSMLLYLVYFSVVLVAFQIFGCSESEGQYFVNLYPVIELFVNLI